MVPFRVDPSRPIYRQVVDAYAAAIARGDLGPGAALPSVRALAEHLRANVNTVQKAYRELEGAGLVQSRPGTGVFVHPDSAAVRAYRSAQREAITRRFLADMAAYGLGPEEAADLARNLAAEQSATQAKGASRHAAGR